MALLKDTLCTLFPPSFRHFLLKMNMILLLSHASVQVFQHAFLVHQKPFFFFPAQPLNYTRLVGFRVQIFRGDAASFPVTSPFYRQSVSSPRRRSLMKASRPTSNSWIAREDVYVALEMFSLQHCSKNLTEQVFFFFLNDSKFYFL